MSDESLIDQLRRLDQEATPGPWGVLPDAENYAATPDVEHQHAIMAYEDGEPVGNYPEDILCEFWSGNHSGRSNGALIVLLRNNLPALLRLVDAAKKWDASITAGRSGVEHASTVYTLQVTLDVLTTPSKIKK